MGPNAAITAAIPELPPAKRPVVASGTTVTVVQAPDFDEDHPEELSYRPFPIAPLMTLTASADDPALAIMTHPDVSRTLDLLDSAGSMPPMRLRPGVKVAELMFSQQFKGEAINLGAMQNAATTPAAAMTNRKVKTQ